MSRTNASGLWKTGKVFLLGQAQRDGRVAKPFPGSIEILTMCTKTGNHSFLLLDNSSLRLLACWHLLPGLISLPRLYAINMLRFSVVEQLVPLYRVSRTHLTPAFLYVHLCVCSFPIPSQPQVSRTTPCKDMTFFHKSCHFITVTKILNTHSILIWPQNCLMWLKPTCLHKNNKKIFIGFLHIWVFFGEWLLSRSDTLIPLLVLGRISSLCQTPFWVSTEQ